MTSYTASAMSSDLSNLWQDLRRRRVFKVAAIYAAGAWVIVQVADVVGPAINMSGWVMTAIVGFAMVGFPIAVTLAWLFDVGPGGVVRTRPSSATGIFAIVASLSILGAGTAGFVWLIKPGEYSETISLRFDPVANSIAVMPFADLTPDKSIEHFADGIAEVLIHSCVMPSVHGRNMWEVDHALDRRSPGSRRRCCHLVLAGERPATR